MRRFHGDRFGLAAATPAHPRDPQRQQEKKILSPSRTTSVFTSTGGPLRGSLPLLSLSLSLCRGIFFFPHLRSLPRFFDYKTLDPSPFCRSDHHQPPFCLLPEKDVSRAGHVLATSPPPPLRFRGDRFRGYGIIIVCDIFFVSGLQRTGHPSDDGRRIEDNDNDDTTYDVVPDLNSDDDDDNERRRKEDEYDEPWEWSVGARLTSSLQVSPAPSLDEERPTTSDLEEEEDEDTMAARQQRRLLYETAFDSRVKRDADDLDRLMQQSPHLFASESVAPRAASRSSFGSTSGSSASSTPTHQPMEIVRQSPRQHFTPTERRRVTLVRDGPLPRSVSPQTRSSSAALKGIVVNQNFERKISFSSNQWDRCSGGGSSDKSSSQESMNVEVVSSRNNERNMLGRSASRDSLNAFRTEDRRSNLLTSNYPNNWKELSTSAKLDDVKKTLPKEDDHHPAFFVAKTGVKVLPSTTKATKACRTSDLVPQDPELKENNSQILPRDGHLLCNPARPSSLLSEVRPMDNLPQSPENDNRSSEDYDPPWDLKINNILRPSGVNGSVSVPERLSSSGGQPQLPTSVTHDKLDSEELKDRPTTATKSTNRPSGPSSRPNLNLNLNSDSPRKGRQNLTLNFGCAALSAVGEKVDPQVTLEKQGWYHGSISRVDAEGKLRVLKEGSYLVRNSESSKRDYSLSLRSARGFMHMKIVPTSEGRFILGQFSNPFSSIPEMIQHYSVNKLPIKGAEHMSLLYPVIDQLL